MLDARTMRALAARPSENGAALNLALAEEGDAHALASLAHEPKIEPEVLAAIVRRVLHGPSIEIAPDEDPPRIDIAWEPADEPRIERPWSLDRALLSLVVLHPRAPAGAISAIVEAHRDEAGFVLAASLSSAAPVEIVERVGKARARSALHDRPWIDLLAARHDVRAIVEAWGTRDEELLREASARLAESSDAIARAKRDPSRRVRRALASNPSAEGARGELAAEDPAIEVRAAATLAPHPHAALQASRALARAARAFERGGDLDERIVDAILANAHQLDPELAWNAGLVFDLETLTAVAQALAEHDARDPSSRALVAAAMVRPGDGAAMAQRGELAGILARAIRRSYVPPSEDAKLLTGSARLVAFLAELLADPRLVDDDALADGLAHGALVGDPALASRWFSLRESRAPGLMARLVPALVAAASHGGRPPTCALEAAWRDPAVLLVDLAKLARVTKPRREADTHLTKRAEASKVATADFDVDTSQRSAADLLKVMESLDPWIRVAPHVALVVLASSTRALACGGREVRGWRDGVVASQIQRVMRAARGAVEADTRVAKIDVHADEAGVAVALLAGTARAAEVAALLNGKLRLHDGVLFAAIVEALWELGRRDDVKVLVDALAVRRRTDPAALAAWLVVGDVDRPRPTSVLAQAIDDPIALAQNGRPLPEVYQALGIVERRHPGALERVRASTRYGQAMVVNALARAYPGLVGSS